MLNTIMGKSTNIVKRKPGRPSTLAASEYVGVRLPRGIVEALDGWAEKNETTRSEAIRRLVELGLKAKGK
jgi:hypothetical protein